MVVVVWWKVCLSVLIACSCFGSLIVHAQRPSRSSSTSASSASTTSNISPSSSSVERASVTSASITDQNSASSSPSSQPTQVIVTVPNGQWQFIPLPQYVRAPGGSLTGDPAVISPVIPANSPYQSLVGGNKTFFSGWRRIAIIAGICGGVLLVLMFSSWAYYKTQKSDDQSGINKGPAPLPNNSAASTTLAKIDNKSSLGNAAVSSPMAEADRPLPAPPQPIQYQSIGVMNAPAPNGVSAAAYYTAYGAQQPQQQQQPYGVYGYAAQPGYAGYGSGYYGANYSSSNVGTNYGSNYAASNVGASPPPQSGNYGY